MGTSSSKYRFIIGLRLLKIIEPFGRGDDGRGDEILDDFLITNDKSMARKFFGPDLSAFNGAALN
jgi:hypothetical protein